MELTELFSAIVAWAEARNLIKGSDSLRQCLKLGSEMGELFAGCSESECEDAIGDMAVVLTIMAAQEGAEIGKLYGLAATHPDSNKLIDSGCADRLVEVNGLLCDAILKRETDKIHSLIGDMMVILYAHCEWFFEASLTECIRKAYNEIKDRKGVMYNGVFIKSTDDRYVGACAELGLTC